MIAKHKEDHVPIYNNMDKKNKSFMYQNFQKQDYFNTNFTNGCFDYACFRGAHLKSCTFNACTFKNAEFMGTNLKDSYFVNAVFDHSVFEGAKLDGANFKDAKFIGAIFVDTKTDKAINLDMTQEGIRVFDKMPELEITSTLKSAVETLMQNPFVKRSRVMDTKDKKMNTISVMLMLERYGEDKLISLMGQLEGHIDRDFYTLSYLIKILDKLIAAQ